MQLGLVIGLGIVISLFLFLAFKLDSSHFFLRLFLIFLSVALIGLIPVVYLIDNVTQIFHKVMMGFSVVFWIYVGGYLFYWGYKKLMAHAEKR